MNNYKNTAICFMNDLPYLKEPYSKRNWGSKWHSLCSYHGKLKPSIAHLLIKTFTERGDIVLDPLSGVGTIPFEACLQGRIGMGNDLSNLAFVVSKAKLEFPKVDETLVVVNDLEKYINNNRLKYLNKQIPYSNFGFNKTLKDYYERNTFVEIVLAREFFKNKHKLSSSEALVMASLMHVLHGNRPYALSRRSHSLTPYAPSGEFEYKNLIKHIKNKLKIVFSEDIQNYTRGEMFYGDALQIHKKMNKKVDVIISSPPFAASIKFYTHNWLRLWFAGWEPEDFKNAQETFLDSLQKKDMGIYLQFFSMCSEVLKDKGKLILHLGKTKNCNMADELIKYSERWFKVIYVADEDVSQIEKHGVKDKGGTTHHQFLFLEKR
ncbi:MAG: hypothetical protein N4A50_14370 [Vallitalea sp.]|jgi:DNA modification methylase|nr:hypothetical protein [Vallitalea sp.]